MPKYLVNADVSTSGLTVQALAIKDVKIEGNVDLSQKITVQAQLGDLKIKVQTDTTFKAVKVSAQVSGLTATTTAEKGKVAVAALFSQKLPIDGFMFTDQASASMPTSQSQFGPRADISTGIRANITKGVDFNVSGGAGNLPDSRTEYKGMATISIDIDKLVKPK